MKKSNRITSLIISAMMSISAVPVISNAVDAEYTEHTLPYEFDSPEAIPPYTIDGDSVIFEGDKNVDFIVSSRSKFTTERTDSSFKFTPTYNSTSFMISRVRLFEEIIDYPVEVAYDLMEGVDVPAGYITRHCHYFYPVIQNFKVTYNINIGTTVEYLGERAFSNDGTIEKIASGEMGICDDFTEMETDDIFNDASYYTLASCTTDNNIFFTYFDYGYESENKKDKSVFCIQGGYYEEYYESGNYEAIDVSGNAEITNTFYGGSYISGDLMEGTADIVAYTTIEPTSDGFVEIYCHDVFPMSSIILDIANGKFIPSYSTIGCVMPEECDLNMDEYINISDAVIFQKYMFGQTKLTNIQRSCADLNYDGSIDIFDMVLLRQRVIEDNHSGLIPEPVDTVLNHVSY